MWRVEGLGLKHLVGVVLSMSGGGTTVGLPEGGIWRKRDGAEEECPPKQVSVFSPGCLRIHSVGPAGLKLREPLASASCTI